MSYLYKVWSADRKKKISLILHESDDMLTDLITKSNNKLGIVGSILVMENDGTVIDDNEVLKFCSDKILMLLRPEESWSVQNETAVNVSSDTASLTCSFNEEPFSGSSSSLSLSSPKIKISNNKQLQDEFWGNFQIPWNNLEPTVLKELKNGSRNKYIINTVVNRIVSEMRNVQEFIPSKAFKIISEKIVDKYPQTFRDINDDGTCFGEGFHTIYLKLRDRNSYLNRPHMKRNLSQSLNIPLNKQKKVLSAKAGCSNWQPEKYMDTETDETIEEKTKFLCQIVHDNSSRNDLKIQHKINSYLEATYPAQRLFLNNVDKIPTIKDIKSTWPILLQKTYMFWHYEKLMGHSIDLLKEEMIKKQEKILSYGQYKKYRNIIDSNYPTEIKLIQIIIRHFKEDFEGLFKTYPEGTLLQDIEPPTMAPCIIIINDAAYRMFYLFYFYIENVLIERTFCFYEALKMLMSVYYIFNMEYPKNCTCTLEFIQKYFLNIHPLAGSKSRRISTKTKVLSFFNKLRDMSNKQNIATHN